MNKSIGIEATASQILNVIKAEIQDLGFKGYGIKQSRATILGYMQTLESASTEGKIEPFTKFVLSELKF